MAEPKPLIFSSTTDSSSAAPVQSNIRRIIKSRSNVGRNFNSQRLKNQNQSSVNSPKVIFSFPTLFTEPVNNVSAKPSTPGPAFIKPSTPGPVFITQLPINPKPVIDGNNPCGSIASPTSLAGDVEASSTVPQAEQSLIVVSRILNGMPQSPHFYQLRNFSELTRKSLISGWDQVFEQTVEELRFLQLVNFWVKAKALWKTMEELQSMGYNVILLRRRLVELTEVMMGLKLAQMEIERLKAEAENHRLESSRLEGIAFRLQEMAMEEKEKVDEAVVEAAKKEDEMPKFDAWFAKLTKDPLQFTFWSS